MKKLIGVLLSILITNSIASGTTRPALKLINNVENKGTIKLYGNTTIQFGDGEEKWLTNTNTIELQSDVDENHKIKLTGNGGIKCSSYEFNEKTPDGNEETYYSMDSSNGGGGSITINGTQITESNVDNYFECGTGTTIDLRGESLYEFLTKNSGGYNNANNNIILLAYNDSMHEISLSDEGDSTNTTTDFEVKAGFVNDSTKLPGDISDYSFATGDPLSLNVKMSNRNITFGNDFDASGFTQGTVSFEMTNSKKATISSPNAFFPADIEVKSGELELNSSEEITLGEATLEEIRDQTLTVQNGGTLTIANGTTFNVCEDGVLILGKRQDETF